MSDNREHEWVEHFLQRKGVTAVHTSPKGIATIIIVMPFEAGVVVRWKVHPLSRRTECEVSWCGMNAETARVKTSPMDKYDPEIGMGVSFLKVMMKLDERWQDTKGLSSGILQYLEGFHAPPPKVKPKKKREVAKCESCSSEPKSI